MLIPAKPQSYAEIFGTAWEIFKVSFKKTLPLFLLMCALSIAGQFASDWAYYTKSMNLIGETILWVVLLLILLYFTYAAFGGIIYRMHNTATGKDPGFTKSFNYGIKKVLPLLAVIILYGLAVAIGGALLIIPGIMALVYLVFATYLLYMDTGIMDSLKESFRLVRHHWWRTAINLLLLLLALFIAAAVFMGIMTLLGMGLQMILSTILGPGHALQAHPLGMVYYILFAILWIIISIAIYNYTIAYMLTCIYDLQLRKKLEPVQSTIVKKH